MKYIQKTIHGTYRVKHTKYYAGTYKTLEEAKKVRDEAIRTDWVEYKNKTPRKYNKTPIRKLKKLNKEIEKGGELYIS